VLVDRGKLRHILGMEIPAIGLDSEASFERLVRALDRRRERRRRQLLLACSPRRRSSRWFDSWLADRPLGTIYENPAGVRRHTVAASNLPDADRLLQHVASSIP